MKPFIPKEDNELPDYYSFTVYYATGKKDTFEVCMHRLDSKTGMLEFWTRNDECHWIVMQNVVDIAFDKNFSKIYAINNRKLRETAAQNSQTVEEEKKEEEVVVPKVQEEKEVVA